MVHHIESQQHLYPWDTLEAVLTDWLYVGRFVSFRGIEWCQTTQKRYLDINHPLWVGPKSYAFVPDDFTFFTKNKQQVKLFTPTSITTIVYVIIRFCK